jgi:putative tryptophan/tyrosine transport system substrate-binding protein
MTQVKRRSFLTLLGGAAAAWPVAAGAQQRPAMPVIGALMAYPETDQEAQARLQAFLQGLVDLGWAEGRNLRVDVAMGRH